MPIPEDGYLGNNGEQVSGGGKVVLPDGTEIGPDGIRTPDGRVIRPEEPYQVSSAVKPPDSEVQAPSASPEDISDGPLGASHSPDAGPSKPPDSSDSAESPVSPETSVPEAPTEPSVTQPAASEPATSPAPTEPQESGALTVEGEHAGGWMPWESQSSIDLFSSRTGGPAERIKPGSSGNYLFRLKNTRSKELLITLTFTEEQLHIPLEFSLTPLDAQGDETQDGIAGSIADKALVLESSIKAGEETVYRLDWKWPFDGSDGVDTAAGMDGGVYRIILKIFAKEKV